MNALAKNMMWQAGSEARSRQRLKEVPLPGNASAIVLSELVVLDRRGSSSGLYCEKKTGIAAAEGALKSDTVLVRTKGLSGEQKEMLRSQNVRIIHVRETNTAGIILRSETSDAENRCRIGLGDSAGEVVPYLAINRQQAERLLRDCTVPEIAAPQACPASERHEIPSVASGLVLYRAMNGGC